MGDAVFLMNMVSGTRNVRANLIVPYSEVHGGIGFLIGLVIYGILYITGLGNLSTPRYHADKSLRPF
ncbi:hypothetical protein HIEAAJJG_00829 [Streptococcus equi subsp. zooepidemicus]|nr:hypothetical protein HIEAAJJG_00829 [Streptococcus equi subsp. zooepidemicus]